MTSLKARAGGFAAAAVLGSLAFAPAAMAAPAAAGDCVPTTSPLVTCAPVVSSPPGVVTLPPVVTPPPVTQPAPKPTKAAGATIKTPPKTLTVGSKITLKLSNLKPGTVITFVVHGNKTSKIKVDKAGEVSFSYTVTKVGSYTVSVSGKMLSGKGFGKSYTTVVKQGSGGSASVGTVLGGAAAGHVAAAGTTVATHATTKHAAVAHKATSAPSAPVKFAGVSLTADEAGSVSLGTVGLMGAIAGVALTGRKQARRRKRHAVARAWR